MFDPAENLGIAMKIYGDKKTSGEVWIRAAVSRCYYSSLLTAKPHLGCHEVRNANAAGKPPKLHRQCQDRPAARTRPLAVLSVLRSKRAGMDTGRLAEVVGGTCSEGSRAAPSGGDATRSSLSPTPAAPARARSCLATCSCARTMSPS